VSVQAIAWALTVQTRRRVFEKTGGCCLYCAKPLATDFEADLWVEAGRGVNATYEQRVAASKGHCSRMQIDHFVPRFRGGADSLENYAPACTSCNSSKRHHHPAEWLRKKRPDLWAEIVSMDSALETWGQA